MAAETEWNCPICSSSQDGVAYVSPCLHQFCLGCILRWTKMKGLCPLCRQPLSTIIFSVRSEGDYLEIVPSDISGPSHDDHQEELEEDEDLDDHQEEPEEVEYQAPRAYVYGFPAEFWASLFQNSQEFLQSILPWVNELLEEYPSEDLALVQENIILTLYHHGLNEEALVWELRPFLQDQTEDFVCQIISIASEQCSEEFLWQMHLLEPEVKEDSSMSIRGPGASQGWTPILNPRAEESDEELGQAMIDPSAAGQGSDCQHPQKRRSSDSEDSDS